MRKYQKRLMIGAAVLSMTIMAAGTAFAAEETVAGGVAVEANADSVTGYRTTFTYVNENATNVQLIGSFDFYEENDENLYAAGFNLKEDDDVRNYLVDVADWNKDSNLRHVNLDTYVIDLEEEGDTGVWKYSIDLPGGSYVYRYNVSYNGGEFYEMIMDPENNQEIKTLGGNGKRSEFFVPYDAEKQSAYDDWTFIAPLENKEDAGTRLHFNYVGKDKSVLPAWIYLPAGYEEEREEPYKVLYLSHGGGGSETDWFHQGHADEIVDRMVSEGKVEPFLIVAMNNTVFNWDYDAIFENMKDYLIPYMEKNYNVSTQADDRAFAGLSMGGMTTSQMLFHDPSLFGYYGVFSGSDVGNMPELDDYSEYNKANIFLGVGFADSAYMNDSYGTDSDRTLIALAEKFDEKGIAYNNGNGVDVAQGGHDWYTWDQLIRDFIDTTLWK